MHPMYCICVDHMYFQKQDVISDDDADVADPDRRSENGLNH